MLFRSNSGMNRLGFKPEQYLSAWSRLNALTQVDEIALMTHFSDADGESGVSKQMAVFERVTRELPGERSVSNSAAVLRHSELKGDWVRPGICLYGSSPDHPLHTSHDWALRPAMSLHARILGTQTLQAGDQVGYGSRFTATGPMTIEGRTIVVAAGATASPALLQASRLPGMSRALGRYITGHPALTVHASHPDIVDGHIGFPKAYWVDEIGRAHV